MLGIFRKKRDKDNLPRTFAYSIKGRKDSQEDAYLITQELDGRQLILVADGVGSQKGAEVASKKVIETFENFFSGSPSFYDPVDFLRKTALVAASQLMYEAMQNPDLANASTTLSGFYIWNDKIYTINAGDSRTYLFRKDKLLRLTKDHTLLQEMTDKGEITEEQAQQSKMKNILTSAISKNISSIKIDTNEFAVQEGDIIFACTDGVHDYLSDRQLEEILQSSQNAPAETIARIIAEAAYDAGSPDNITVVIHKH